jgi:hypothetical protein
LTAPTVITSDKTATTPSLGVPRNFVPLRADPAAPDPDDPRRIVLVKEGWGSLDDLVRQQNRQIEENVRMLSGQQHALYHPVFGKWIDVTEWMSDEERRWRQRPVFNRLLPWFIITHARSTENQPIVTFVPGPDRADSELAELLDIASKTVWFEAGMEDVHDRLMGWVIVAGRGHLLSRINPNKGQMRKWVGEDMVPVVDTYDRPVDDGEGGQAQQMAKGVPFDKDGNPLARWRQTGPGAGELVPHGEAHQTPIGGIEVDVLSPMQVRGSWGPTPWHQKRRHWIRSYHSPEEVYDLWGVDVAPDVRGGMVSDVGELERLLYGSGFYGSVNGGLDTAASTASTDGYVEVTQMWEAPCRYGGMEAEGDSPGGRWLVTSRSTVIRDGVRPAKFPYTSPLNTFEFVRIPGRPGGTTPQEALNPVQRAYNDGHARIGEHVNLSTNPKAVIDSGSGLKSGKFTNKPGENYVLARRPNVPAIEYITPPSLGADVYKRMQMLREEFHDIGFMAGANDPGTPGDSGEKVKEVRFNTDRFLGPTMRRTAGEYGRVFETWQALYPLMWDMETTISYAGDDNIARTITAFPYMFEQGKVNVRTDVESMLPEGRGERQEQVFKMYMNNMFGLAGTPQALKKFWEMARMPHLSRAAKPGGIHTTTAEQENGQLLLGAQAATIPVWEWYDDDAHLAVHEQFMASPEFKKLRPEVQDAFAMHRKAHLFSKSQKMAQQVAAQANVNAALNPAPAPNGGGGGKPNKNGGPPNTSVRPALPTPPSGGVPGGTMPTVTPAPAGV